MAEPRVVLFCEDAGHELFTRSLLLRLGREADANPRIEAKSAAGGHGRALDELRAYQRAIQRRLLDPSLPDLLVVVIDANRRGSVQREQEVRAIIDPGVFPRFVVGCPDPYVERWCFADPEAFHRVIGVSSPSTSDDRDRATYKGLLKTTILAAGQTIATDPMEFAPDLVKVMDLYRAGKYDVSLGRFVEALRRELKQHPRP